MTVKGDTTSTADPDASTDAGYGAQGAAGGVAAGYLGRYRIDDVLGSGGMGVVLAAHDPELDRKVAIKVLHQGEPAMQARLLREAQAMARLRHANVITVHDVGETDGRVFVAMELVAGATLRAWLTSARPWRTIVATMVAAARGLAAAHAAGIVHRDFKLDNVMVGDDGVVRVGDFGLASTGEALATAPGRVAGTPAYMAPEQHDGAEAGPAADQFAFGVALWEALCGSRPFAGTSVAALAEAKRNLRLAPPARRPPRWTLAIARRALAPAPDDRFPSMNAVIAALERGLRRRRRIITAALAAGAIAATAVITCTATAGDPRPSCGGARDAVAAVWSADARARLDAAFAASTRPHAAATRELVRASLDRYAAVLGDARVATCEATHVRGEQSPAALDRRMACLDRRGEAMSALIAVLAARRDETVIDSAQESVLALPDPAACAAATIAAIDPPAPALAAEVAAARTASANVEALLATGQFDTAAAAVVPLVATARRLGYPPLLAETLTLAARVADERRDGALASYQSAAEAAAAAGDDLRIADAWVHQLQILADDLGKPQSALERLPLAEVAVTRAGTAQLREELLVARSDIHLALARHDEALADIVAARTAIEDRLGPRRLELARVLQRQAVILSEMDRTTEELALERQALALFTEALGPDHPKVGLVLNNLGASLESTGDYDEARRVLERALAIGERTFGPDGASVASTLNNLGMVANSQGRTADAIALGERALAIFERTLGPEHPRVGEALNNLANRHVRSGDSEVALELLRRALPIQVAARGPTHSSVAYIKSTMAVALRMLDRNQEALAAAQEALAIGEAAFGRDHVFVADAHEIIGDIQANLGRDADSCASYARALAIIEKVHGRDHVNLVGLLAGHAECELGAGRAAAAVAVAERAAAIGRANGSWPALVAQAELLQARALWAAKGDRVRAIALARAAHATLVKDGTAAALGLAADAARWLRERGAAP